MMSNKVKLLLLVLITVILLLAVNLFSTSQELTDIKQDVEIEKQKPVLDEKAEEFLEKLYEGKKEHLALLSKDALSRIKSYKEDELNHNHEEGQDETLNEVDFYVTKTEYEKKKYTTTSYIAVSNKNKEGYMVDKIFLIVTIEWAKEDGFKVDRYDFQLVNSVINESQINAEL